MSSSVVLVDVGQISSALLARSIMRPTVIIAYPLCSKRYTPRIQCNETTLQLLQTSAVPCVHSTIVNSNRVTD